MAADIIDKATGAVEQSALDSIDLDSASIVRLDMSRDAVVALEKSEKDLLVRLADGQVIRVADFYERFDGRDNNLILREADGTQWLAQSSSRFPRFSLLNHLDALIGRFTGNAVCALYFENQRGHPILFPKSWFSRLMALQGDCGARSLLRETTEVITTIPALDDAILRDIDRLEDFPRN